MDAKRIGIRTAWGVIGIAIFVLLGWVFRIEVITSVIPGLVSMKVNTALNFLLLGLAALLMHRNRNLRLRKALAIVAVLISAVTLVEIVAGLNLYIDELLIPDFENPARTALPGQMSPLSALSFLLFGLGMILHERKREEPSYWLILATLVISVAVFSSYPYSLLRVTGLFSYTGMALNTAILFILLSISMLMALPQRIWLVLIFSDQLFGRQGRRLIAAAILSPLAGGAVTVLATSRGLIAASFAQALFAASIVVVLIFLLQTLASMAIRDPLTQAYNRTYFERALKNMLSAEEKGKQTAVLFIDLDGFKQVNDTWGHAVGDRVLQQTADSIRLALRSTDVLSRLGGDEFAVAFPITEENAAEVVVSRILSQIKAIRDEEVGDVGIDASIGVTIHPKDGTDVDEIIRLSDRAMYSSKAQGRSVITYAADIAGDFGVPTERG